MSEMRHGQMFLMPVTWLEERNGGALVRLPNGSKTTVRFRDLEVLPMRGDVGHTRSGVQRVYCGDDSGCTCEPGEGRDESCGVCQWSAEVESWPAAVALLTDHYVQAHPPVADGLSGSP